MSYGTISNEVWDRLMVPKRYWGASLDVFAGLPHEGDVRRIFDGLPRMIRSGRGVAFFGNYSCGKSSLAAMVLREAWTRFEVIGLWVRARDLYDIKIGELEDAGGNSIWDRIEYAPLLVLDEVLFVKGGAAGADRIQEDVLRRRVDEMRSTFITTNHSRAYVEENAPSFFAASVGSIKWVHVEGYDFREDPEGRLKGI